MSSTVHLQHEYSPALPHAGFCGITARVIQRADVQDRKDMEKERKHMVDRFLKIGSYTRKRHKGIQSGQPGTHLVRTPCNGR
jgi:hypothetical protein